MEIFFPWEVVSQYVPWDIPVQYVPHFYGIFFTAIATFYVMLGGMLSIVWTDVVQFLIMTVAGVVIAIIGMNMVAPEMIREFVPAGWESPFFGWTLDIDWSERMSLLTERMADEPYSLMGVFVMMALLKGIFMSMAGPAPNYDMQKILSCKSPKEAALMSGSVSVILLIPRYLMIQEMHLFNTIGALIVPGMISAFSIYMARQFIADVPDSLCEAAKIDGAGPFRIYWSVILPNIKPAIGSIGIFTAMMNWNDYLNPLLMLNDMEKMTLPLGLVIFDTQRVADMSATMAAASMMMMPMIIIFVIFQKQFVKGMTMSGIK